MLNACCVTKGAVPNFFLKKPWSLFQGSLACSIAHFVQYGWKCLVLFSVKNGIKALLEACRQKVIQWRSKLDN